MSPKRAEREPARAARIEGGAPARQDFTGRARRCLVRTHERCREQLRAITSPKGGAFEATCARAKLAAIDTTKPEIVALGSVALPGCEDNTLRLTCTNAPQGKPARLDIDYFILSPVVAEDAIEAETLKILAEQLSGKVQRWCPGKREYLTASFAGGQWQKPEIARIHARTPSAPWIKPLQRRVLPT